MSSLGKGIARLSFFDKNKEIYSYDKGLEFYTKEINLPQDYSAENDAENRNMEYVPLPEKMKSFLSLWAERPLTETHFSFPARSMLL